MADLLMMHYVRISVIKRSWNPGAYLREVSPTFSTATLKLTVHTQTTRPTSILLYCTVQYSGIRFFPFEAAQMPSY